MTRPAREPTLLNLEAKKNITPPFELTQESYKLKTYFTLVLWSVFQEMKSSQESSLRKKEGKRIRPCKKEAEITTQKAEEEEPLLLCSSMKPQKWHFENRSMKERRLRQKRFLI